MQKKIKANVSNDNNPLKNESRPENGTALYLINLQKRTSVLSNLCFSYFGPYLGFQFVGQFGVVI